jgi:multidrug efflux pump subunit AcrA (membrane-fusion protein)
MEIEVPNPGFRLKPGMYARVQLTTATRPDALTVPANALVTVEGKAGVFVAAPADAGTQSDGKTMTARFTPIESGIRDGQQIEIVAGLRDGARIVTTGAGALKDGDRIVAAAAETPVRGRANETQGAGSGRR